jgi:hypothetical protein
MVAFLLIQTVALAMLLISNLKKGAAFRVVLSASVMQNVYFFHKIGRKVWIFNKNECIMQCKDNMFGVSVYLFIFEFYCCFK